MNRREFSILSILSAGLAFLPPRSAEAEMFVAPSPCSPLPELPVAPSPEVDQKLFAGFTAEDVKTSGATIRVFRKGSGPPLLLLHGHPETHVTWHKNAAELALEYSVVIPDLRGYGDSSKPDGGERHINYSFRAMAQDQVETMRHFGHERFFVAGHGRGARATHRLCLDHPESVRKVCLMDIAPTLTMYRDTTKEFATKYVWWFLQIQPFPMPEHLISLDPAFYLQDHLQVQGKTPGAVTPEALSEYLRRSRDVDAMVLPATRNRTADGVQLQFASGHHVLLHRAARPRRHVSENGLNLRRNNLRDTSQQWLAAGRKVHAHDRRALDKFARSSPLRL